MLYVRAFLSLFRGSQVYAFDVCLYVQLSFEINSGNKGENIMRHGSSGRRQKNRGGSRGNSGGNSRTQVFDSNGPDVRIRGTAFQVHEKYMALAKDALSSGDYIASENYFQHAEHYQRVINGFGEQQQTRTPQKDKAPQKAEGNKQKSDDLSLHASILGAESEAKNEVAEAV